MRASSRQPASAVVAVVLAALGTASATGCGEAASAPDGHQPLSPTERRSEVSIQVSPAETSLAPGDTLRFRATATDGQGAELEASFTWSSSDASVATVDETGLATAVAEGEAAISARTATATGRASLRVVPAATPEVVAFEPDPLREGEPALLRGRGFRSDPARNVVLLDGREVEVDAASDREVRFTVPRFDCRPPRSGELRVAVGGDTTGALRVRLEPADPDLGIAPGELRRVSGREGLCLRFGRSSADEAYLVGVQSTGTSPGRTRVRLTGEVGTPGEAALEAAATVVGGEGAGEALRPGPTFGPPADPRISPEGERRLRHRRAEARLRALERRLLSSARRPELRAAGPRARATWAGPGATVGDTVPVRVPNLESTCTFHEVRAVVRAVGERGIWLEDPENPAGGFAEADYGTLSDHLDRRIYDVDRAYFGEPTDVDGNGRIVVLVTKELNAASPGDDGEGEILGFVFSGDLFPRSDCASSDGGEIYYARAPDPEGTFGRPFSRSTALSEAVVTMGHELAHIIQLGRRLLEVDAPRFMESWVMEGQATLAEEVIGHAILGNEPGLNYGSDVALADAGGGDAGGPEAYDWYSSAFVDLAHYFGFRSRDRRVAGAPAECSWLREDSTPCDGRPLWYGVSWSLLRWLSDHYGARFAGGERELHRALVDNARVGFENLTAVTGLEREEMLARWAAALYADDRLEGADPTLAFRSWNLAHVFDEGMMATARLRPLERRFDAFELDLEVAGASSAYVLLQGDGTGRPPASLRARDPAGGALPDRLQLWVLRLR